MKIQCQIETVNRLLPIINMRQSGSKHLKSTLALGKESKNPNEYFMIHFSSAHKTGIKYKINQNIKQVFVKHINDGKSTIRLIEPPYDLLIKCDPLLLKSFMKTLRCCLTGDVNNLKLSNLSNLSVTSKDNAPKKLVIRDRSEYPNKGMPRTLESVYINGIKMCNFRREILLLRHLTILDISNNEIEKLPPELGRMPNIQELHLGNNLLGVKGGVDWRWLFGAQIKESLRLLDLSNNRLGHIPKAIWKLCNLVTLKLDHNMLNTLPESLGRVRTLRFLTVAENELTSLPCSMIQLKLEYIDLSSNCFHNKEDSSQLEERKHWDLYVGNLVNLSGSVVLKNKINYASNIIPFTLVYLLDSAHYCLCGNPVLSTSYYVYKYFELKDYFKTVVFDSNRGSSVYFDCHFCSNKCMLRFQ